MMSVVTISSTPIIESKWTLPKSFICTIVLQSRREEGGVGWVYVIGDHDHPHTVSGVHKTYFFQLLVTEFRTGVTSFFFLST